MVGRERGQAQSRVEKAAVLGLKGEGLLDQSLCRRGAKEHQGLGFDQVELLPQDLYSLPDLARPRRTVLDTPPVLLRRANLDDVGHVDLRAVDTGLFEQFVEQLPGVAHERAALLDLPLARRLPHDGESGTEHALPEHRVFAEHLRGTFLELLPLRLPGHPSVTSLLSDIYPASALPRAGRRGGSRPPCGRNLLDLAVSPQR